MKAANKEQNLNKSNERFKSAQLSKPAPIYAFGKGEKWGWSFCIYHLRLMKKGVTPYPLCANTLRGISQLKMESGKWKVSLDDLLPAQFIYPWKMVLEQLGIFPSPMGEDRISKFVRTLEILGEGRRKVESGILQWKVGLKQSSVKHTRSCLSEGKCILVWRKACKSLSF